MPAAGVPILTLGRESMISRVAASLALAAGLPALVALTVADYHAVAAALVPSGPAPAAKLRRLRAATLRAREGSAVFDTALWVRHLDRALAAAWDSDVVGRRGGGGKARRRGGGPEGGGHHVVVHCAAAGAKCSV
jgi:predicted O-linked N-acetylglucosamine transferase (SPINDLY family)